MDSSIIVGDVTTAIKSVNQSILQTVLPVDIYISKKDKSSKDVLFSLTFQSPKKTLEDNDVNTVITDLGKFDILPNGVKINQAAPNVGIDEIRSRTEATIID